MPYGLDLPAPGRPPAAALPSDGEPGGRPGGAGPAAAMGVTHPAQQLGSGQCEAPKEIRDLLTKARTTWLRNSEVEKLLKNWHQFGFKLSGSLFLFNRNRTRFFRRDQHDWRKKSDGKTVRETHEKLKVDNRDALNCYYAHAHNKDSLQRRCYWLLEEKDNIVLVHYLHGGSAGRPRPTAMAASSGEASSSQRSCQFAAHQRSMEGIARAGSVPESFGSALGPPGGYAGSAPTRFIVTTGGTAGHAPPPPAAPATLIHIPHQACSRVLDVGAAGTAGPGDGPPPAQMATPFAAWGPEARALSPPRSATDCARAASVPVLALQRLAHPDESFSLGPLHSAPSFSGGTVQTGSTVDPSELRARSGSFASAAPLLESALASPPGPAPPAPGASLADAFPSPSGHAAACSPGQSALLRHASGGLVGSGLGEVVIVRQGSSVLGGEAGAGEGAAAGGNAIPAGLGSHESLLRHSSSNLLRAGSSSLARQLSEASMGMHHGGLRGRPPPAGPPLPGSAGHLGVADAALTAHAGSVGMGGLLGGAGPGSHADAMSRHSSVTGPLQLPPPVAGQGTGPAGLGPALPWAGMQPTTDYDSILPSWLEPNALDDQ